MPLNDSLRRAVADRAPGGAGPNGGAGHEPVVLGRHPTRCQPQHARGEDQRSIGIGQGRAHGLYGPPVGRRGSGEVAAPGHLVLERQVDHHGRTDPARCGSALFQERIVVGVAEAPAQDGPLDAVACGLAAAAAMLGEFRRDLAHQRHAVIAANPELRERELAKLADYAAAGGNGTAPQRRG